MPLTPADLARIHQEAYRAGLWEERVDKPLVQAELTASCWQAVHDAMRAEYDAEIKQLKQCIADLQTITISAIEAHA